MAGGIWSEAELIRGTVILVIGVREKGLLRESVRVGVVEADIGVVLPFGIAK